MLSCVVKRERRGVAGGARSGSGAGTAEHISRAADGRGGRIEGCGFDDLTAGDVTSLTDNNDCDEDDDDDDVCWPLMSVKSHGDHHRHERPSLGKSRPRRDVTDDFMGDVIGDDLLPL